MKRLALMLLGMIVISLVQAETPLANFAGFECYKASLPIEKAICSSRALSKADSRLNDAYIFLHQNCRDVIAHADLRDTQRRWLTGMRKSYVDGGMDALARLEAEYRTRNKELSKLLAECNPNHGPVHATVKMVKKPGTNDLLPFVETNPPESGWRINKALFRFYGATPPLEFGGLEAFFAEHKYANDSGYEAFSLVYNQGNMLVLLVHGTECQPDYPKCAPYDIEYIFDIRTGSVVSFNELFTVEGQNLLLQQLKKSLLSLASSKLASIPKSDADAYGDQYKQCVSNWSDKEHWKDYLMYEYNWPTYASGGVVANFAANGSLQFVFGNCSQITPYGPDPEEPGGTALDNLLVTIALPEVRLYLNAYGKSLLLGDGQVSAPN